MTGKLQDQGAGKSAECAGFRQAEAQKNFAEIVFLSWQSHYRIGRMRESFISCV
jgi:hypothetical protein